jgi:hypothetical protein
MTWYSVCRQISESFVDNGHYIRPFVLMMTSTIMLYNTVYFVSILSPSLQDYATNLLQTGVHGAMLFLERDKFSADQLGQVLQLPSGKHVARKHLAQQMARLFRDEGTG